MATTHPRSAKLAPSTAPRVAYPGPHLNALKHGLRSGHVLLPGDNIAEFRKLRHRLFHFHQPRTIAEAKHVETLAANEWRLARCRLEQQFFKYHLGVAMSGHPDTTGSLSSPDLHALHHRGTDCQREERRLQISSSESETALALHQKQRTQNLTPRLAEVLEDYTVFLEEGEPVVEEGIEAADLSDAPAESPTGIVGRASLPDRTGRATSSADGGNSNGPKRNAEVPVQRFPKHWSRRQREAALRQQTEGKAAG